MNRCVLLLIALTILSLTQALAATRQDSLRGSNGPGRAWWDVEHYRLTIETDTASEHISGYNEIILRVVAPPGDSLQLDLQEPMLLDSILYQGKKLEVKKEGNVWWVIYPFHQWHTGTMHRLTAFYHGRPKMAKMPPWDGGFIRTKDSTGKLWTAVACQGVGASTWWPCKDHQADEPDQGMDIHFITNSPYPVISNGRLVSHDTTSDSHNWHWRVRSPINTYNVTFYIGDYIHWHDTLMGENGRLDLDFYALRHNEAKAHEQFSAVKPMLRCFEYWMGPYPFYADGYKLVEAPYAGMEHQSAIAYGNEYKMGYKGNDRSGTGVGMLFDFIIVHESGHEWFGNSITAADVADNWIHEGFTTYTEALFAECLSGKEKAFTYTRGEWNNIRNDRPVIGQYGVHDHGSGDKYDKGAAVVHMIRTLIDDDDRFRSLLRSLNQAFYHKTLSSAEIETFINRFAGYNFTPLFDQFLRTNLIPELEYFVKDKQLFYRFNHAVPGFALPLRINDGKRSALITVTSEWQHMRWKGRHDVAFSGDFLFRK